MSKFEQFLANNPKDPRVVKLLELANQPLSINGKLGKLIGELMREVG